MSNGCPTKTPAAPERQEEGFYLEKYNLKCTELSLSSTSDKGDTAATHPLTYGVQFGIREEKGVRLNGSSHNSKQPTHCKNAHQPRGIQS